MESQARRPKTIQKQNTKELGPKAIVKRRIFTKLGYTGYNEGDIVPDEIFQMLYLVSQNEKS